MIFGIGTDVLQVDRMAASCARQPRIAARILGPQEFEIYQERSAHSARRGLLYLCTRFAAKEAFAKACGLGMRPPMSWQTVEVLNQANGAPQLIFHQPMAKWLTTRSLSAHVSISEEIAYVLAFVILESSAHNPR